MENGLHRLLERPIFQQISIRTPAHPSKQAIKAATKNMQFTLRILTLSLFLVATAFPQTDFGLPSNPKKESPAKPGAPIMELEVEPLEAPVMELPLASWDPPILELPVTEPWPLQPIAKLPEPWPMPVLELPLLRPYPLPVVTPLPLKPIAEQPWPLPVIELPVLRPYPLPVIELPEPEPWPLPKVKLPVYDPCFYPPWPTYRPWPWPCCCSWPRPWWPVCHPWSPYPVSDPWSPWPICFPWYSPPYRPTSPWRFYQPSFDRDILDRGIAFDDVPEPESDSRIEKPVDGFERKPEQVLDRGFGWDPLETVVGLPRVRTDTPDRFAVGEADSVNGVRSATQRSGIISTFGN